MIEIFRKNIFVNSLLLLPYVCLLRIHSLINPQAYVIQDTDGPLSTMFYSFIGSSGLFHSILAIIFIFFQAVFINRIVIMNRLENESSLLPGVFYIIFISAISEFLIFSPLIIGLTFIMFSLTELFQTYKKPKSDHLIFICGFWTGVGALFYFPCILYLLVVVVGLVILRSVKFKEWFQVIVGVGIPFFLFGTILFWQDSLGQLWHYMQSNAGFFEKIRGLSNKEIIVFSSVGLLILASLLSYGAITSRKSIQISKKIDILYWGLFVSIFVFGLRQPDSLSDIQFISIPICVFLAFLFHKIENKMISEIFHLVLITLIIVGHFQT